MRSSTVIRSERLAQRRRAVRAERRRRRRKVFLGVVLLAASLAGSWSVARTRLFQLTAVEITGAQLVPAERILSAAGVTTGARVVGLDLERIASSIRRLETVRDVRVERDGLTLRIHVVERTPIALVRSPKGTTVVDDDGRALPGVQAPRSLPLIEIKSTDERVIVQAVRAWVSLPEPLRGRADDFAVGADGLGFLLGTIPIVLGGDDQLGGKIRALRTVLEFYADTDARLRRIDVRSPERPAAVVA